MIYNIYQVMRYSVQVFYEQRLTEEFVRYVTYFILFGLLHMWVRKYQ